MESQTISNYYLNGFQGKRSNDMGGKRGYQFNFSENWTDEMYDHLRRERKAKTILTVFQDYFNQPLGSMNLLDIGASTGIITSNLADSFQQVIGLDIDFKGLLWASSHSNKNSHFIVGDGMNTPFPDNYFDAVNCTHIYEHVPNAISLVDEIFRVLKPGGVCYFAAGNRLLLMEPHYNLPFLSVIPRNLADIYIRLFGKADIYYERLRTYWGLRKLVSKFEIVDYTHKIINSPDRFHAEYIIKKDSNTARIAKLVAKYAYWMFPTYIWLLVKPNI